MTDRDPKLFGDQPSDEAIGFELPLELYFAEDRGDPETIAANASLEAGVLDRVASERGFVSRRDRTLIRACRSVALIGALCVLLAAAVADRLGVAPWTPDASAGSLGPVSGLVASTSEETAGTIEQARDLRDRLLQVVTPVSAEPPAVVAVTLRASSDTPLSHRAETHRATDAVLLTERNCGPYLTAEGFGTTRSSSVTMVIRFDDGFSVPVMAGDASAELRWPTSCDVAVSAVSFNSGDRSASCTPPSLSPAWYASRPVHQMTTQRTMDRPR